MKKIGFINELNISPEEFEKLPIHEKVRGVVFLSKAKNKIVCIEERKHGIENLLGLPGGGVETDEDKVAAFSREVKEETGYEIGSPICIGMIDVVRETYISRTYCFYANTNSKKEDVKLTLEEVAVNTRSVEIDFEEVYRRISEEFDQNQNDHSLRSLLILEEVKKDVL